MSLIDKHFEFEYYENIQSVFNKLLSVAPYVNTLNFESYSYQNFTIVLKGKTTWLSWGETVTIYCRYVDANRTAIHIQSVPVVATTLFDYGKGKKNIKNVVEAMSRVLRIDKNIYK